MIISPFVPKTAPVLTLRAGPPAGRPAPGPQCFRPVPTDPGAGLRGEWGGGRATEAPGGGLARPAVGKMVRPLN